MQKVTLDEYVERGNYHERLELARSFIPRYLRKLFVSKEFIKENLNFTDKILDVGCGEGILVKELNKLGFINAEGIDPYAPHDEQFLKRGSITNLPYEDTTFDFLISLDVLEHIPLNDQKKAARELYRVCKDDSMLLISVPNMAHFSSRFKFLFKGTPWRNDLEKHPGELSATERIKVLSDAGFKLQDSCGIYLTLFDDPKPKKLLGRLKSKIMFHPYAPTNLCWTVMFLFSKGKMKDNNEQKYLKRYLGRYIPSTNDPTY